MALLGREFIAVPDDRKGQIVFKWPDITIRRFTRAIVNADEMALFVNTGQVVQTMGPGRHQIDANELPGLGVVIDSVTGGNAYRAELYFVGTREYTGFKFGGRVDDVQDPRTGLVVTLRVFGDYALRVADPVRLITNMTATVDVTDNERIAGWVSDQLLKVLRTHVTTQIIRNGWPILGPDGVLGRDRAGHHRGRQRPARRLRRAADPDGQLRRQPLPRGRAAAQAAGQGHQLLAAGRRLPELRGRRDGARRGPGHGQGRRRGRRGVPRRRVRAGQRVRRAAGAGPAGAQAQAAQQAAAQYGVPYGQGAPYAPPQPPPQPQASSGPVCASCQAQNPAGAKFCMGCGQALAPAVQHCTECGTELPASAHFCSGCGTRVGG